MSARIRDSWSSLGSELRWSAARTAHRARHTGYAVASAGALHTFYRMIAPELLKERPPADQAQELNRRFHALLTADLANVEEGWYPESLLRQLPVREYLARLPMMLFDAPRVVSRKKQNRYDDVPASASADAYPRYYLRNFHWQTDGWLSARSARLYDPSVELLFGGTADIMRRMAIPALARGVRAQKHPRILDVGCGTGRFMYQLSKSGLSARLFGVDLSGFYIKEAGRTLADVPDVSLVVDNAERLPFDDETFDAVVSIFMFHELPRAVRRRVAAEMLRVLKPGGTLVINDSAQFIESSSIRFFLERFATMFHEPYYRDYLKDDLEALFEQAGLQIRSSGPYAVSKVVAGVRPPAAG